MIEGLGFRGGSDEKMKRMWLGRETVVAGLFPLIQLLIDLSRFKTNKFEMIKRTKSI